MKKTKNNTYIHLFIFSVFLNVVLLFFCHSKSDTKEKEINKILREKDSLIYCRDSALFVWKDSYERVKRLIMLDTAKINKRK